MHDEHEKYTDQGARGSSGSPTICTIQLKASDVLRMLTPGGGGWGRVS